jgi:hypothetical protein
MLQGRLFWFPGENDSQRRKKRLTARHILILLRKIHPLDFLLIFYLSAREAPTCLSVSASRFLRF